MFERCEESVRPRRERGAFPSRVLPAARRILMPRRISERLDVRRDPSTGVREDPEHPRKGYSFTIPATLYSLYRFFRIRG
jgi:hypothetical protein